MHKHLGHRFTAHIHILNLLWCYVLPLSQLEDVLLPVNNLQNATLFTRQSGEITLDFVPVISTYKSSVTVGNNLYES